MENNNNDKFKCTKCGKSFRDSHNLRLHKNKKVSCDVVKETFTCTHCNKNFFNKYSLARHVSSIEDNKIQKIKDEYQKKILEKDKIIEEKDKTIELIVSLVKENTELRAKQNTTINNNLTQNFVIHSFNTPDLSYMINKENLSESPFYKLFAKHLVQTPIELITAIYFDPQHKENQSIELVNKREKKLNLVKDGQRTINVFGFVQDMHFRDLLYDTTLKLVNEVNPILTRTEIEVGKSIERNKDNSTLMVEEQEKIYTKLEDGRLRTAAICM